MIELDGSEGEGGGQVLRTALSLSMATGRPFRIGRVRAGRSNPGLRRQHRTAVRAAAELTDAEVAGDRLGSREVTFRPTGAPRPGEYRFDTGGAGSATLVLQTLLPPLLAGEGAYRIAVDGGTHNPAAPPHEFLARSWLPLLRSIGADTGVTLERAGFFPGGGGRLAARVDPAPPPTPLTLRDRGDLRDLRARSHIAGLPGHVAERELATVQAALEIRDDRLEAVDHGERPAGVANVLVVEVESEAVTEVFTEHGRRGLPAEEVAARAARRARRYLESDAAVWRHLADQLPVPLALCSGGTYRTGEPSSHTRTVLNVVRAFLEIGVGLESAGAGTWEISVEDGDVAA